MENQRKVLKSQINGFLLNARRKKAYKDILIGQKEKN